MLSQGNASFATDTRSSSFAKGWLMRMSYDAKLALGEIEKMPDNLTGWQVGPVRVVGRAEEANHWRVHNLTPPDNLPHDYDLPIETLMASFEAGLLTPGINH